jgi:predicted O-methyltransferase YrrM
MILPSKEFIDKFKATPGALSVCESIAIMNIAAQAPESSYLELGTYRGKSALSALVTLKNGSFDLVEPEFIDENIRHDVMTTIGKTNNVNVNLIPDYSTNIIELYNHLCYVFVDSGSHQDGLPMQEVKLLEDRVVQGGIIAFHDFLSQFREVHEAYYYLVETGKYEEIPINWQEIVEYVKENDLEKGNDSWHHTEMEFPCFVGALKRK